MQLFYFILLINVWRTLGIKLNHHTHKTRIAIDEVSSINIKVGMPKLLLLSSHTKYGTAIDNIPSIKVTFSDGTEDFAILKHHNPFPQSKSWNPSLSYTYLGHMRSDPSALIAVTGCIQKDDDKIYVTLLSKRSRHHIRFSIDGKGVSLHHNTNLDNVDDVHSANFGDPVTGTPTKALRPWDRAFRDPGSGGIIIPNIDAADIDYAVDYTDRVPFAMELKIRIGYDQGYYDSFLTDQERINYLAEVMTHVQPYFRLESFKHHIYLNIIGDPLHVDRVMNLSTAMAKPEFADNIAIDWVRTNNDPETGVYAFVSGSRDDEGPMGVATPGSVCRGNGTDARRVSVSYGTRTRPVVETAWTITHEIGHNLGIKHPQVSRNKVKLCLQSRNGEPIECGNCNSLGPNGQCCSGFMAPSEGGNTEMGWSRCSVKNFESEYSDHRWQRKRCLPAVEARFPTQPPTPAAPTAESRFAPTASPKPLYQDGPLKWEWKERSLVLDEGEDALYEHHSSHKGMSNRTIINPDPDDPDSLGIRYVGFSGRTLAQCQKGCERLDPCHSITYREFDGACYWKKKCVTIDEPANANPVWGWKSYFMPRDNICGTSSPTVSPTRAPTSVERPSNQYFRATISGPVSNSPEIAQCTNWKHWRANMGKWDHVFDRITFTVSGPQIPSREFECNGANANQICHALRKGYQEVTVNCDGNTWTTGSCGFAYGLEVNAAICGRGMCGGSEAAPIDAAGLHPCISNSIYSWGHAGSGCDEKKKSFEVICSPTASPTPPPTLPPLPQQVDGLRLVITKSAGGSYVCVSELKFFLGGNSYSGEVLSQRKKQGVEVTSNGGVYASRRPKGIFEQWGLYCSARNSCPSSGECPSKPTLTITLPTSITFDEYSILGAGYYAYRSFGPASWELEGYDAKEDTWRTIHEVEDYTFSRSRAWATFKV